jgi:hypothetical protein
MNLPPLDLKQRSNYLVLLGEKLDTKMHQKHQIFFGSFGDILKGQNHAMKHA